MFGIRQICSAKTILRIGMVLGITTTIFCAASPASANPKYAGIVVDAKTGKTLYASSADAYRYPASLTKIMTLYVVFQELEAGRLTLNSRFKVSKYAAGRPPSKLGLVAGKTIKVKDAILALVTKSANDVATTVAENISGSEGKFAERMTRTARSLGMKKTTFRNAHGLPNSKQRTTARDMALLGRAIQEHFPQYYGYFKTRSYKYRGRTYGNHNRLLGSVKGVDGIKTGYIRASGFNLVTSVKRDGRHIVAVVMGGKTGASRNAHMTNLISRYLRKASRGRKTVPAIAKRSVQPTFVASAIKNPPMPTAKPGRATTPAVATGAPLVLAETLPSADAIVPLPDRSPVASAANVPGFSGKVPLPPRTVKRRFDDTFMVANALPPIPRQNPDSALTTNGITQTALLASAQKKFGIFNKASNNGAASNQPLNTAALTREELPAPAVEIGALPAIAATTQALPPIDSAPATTAASVSEDDTVTVATSDTKDIVPGWQVQIAAAETEGQAIKMLKTAKSKTGSALRGRVPHTEPVESNGQTLYRARFVGFDTKTQARRACRTLKKAKFACFAIYQ